MRRVASFGSLLERSKSAHESSALPAGRLHPSDPAYRRVILAVTCLLTFGSYFCFDTPGALVTEISRGLDLTSFEYNVLFSVYSWPNTVLVFVGGVLIDRYGNRFSAVALSVLVLVGQLVMAVGVALRAYWLLLVGRFLFGVGGESLTVCQSTIVSKWFSGRELAMAFGFSLTVSRVGSILCFNTLPFINARYGLTGAFAAGAVVCAVSIGAAFAFVYLDAFADRVVGTGGGLFSEVKVVQTAAPPASTEPRRQPEQQQQEEEEDEARSRDCSFGLSFWLCSTIGMLSYALVFSFIAVGGDFFHLRYGASRAYSGFLVSLIYNVSMVMAPLLGRVLDKIGMRGVFVFGSCALSALAFGMLGAYNPHGDPLRFARVPPAAMLALGISFSGISSAIWPSMSLVVPASTLGTALGVAQAQQNFGTSIASVFVGRSVDVHGYGFVMSMFSRVSIMAMALSLWWNAHDWRKHDGRINRALQPEAEVRQQMIEAGLAEAYMPLYVPVYVMVSPHSVVSVRRSYYAQLGEGEVGMGRRDLYARLGIAHPEVARKAASSGVRIPNPEAAPRSRSSSFSASSAAAAAAAAGGGSSGDCGGGGGESGKGGSARMSLPPRAYDSFASTAATFAAPAATTRSAVAPPAPHSLSAASSPPASSSSSSSSLIMPGMAYTRSVRARAPSPIVSGNAARLPSACSSSPSPSPLSPLESLRPMSNRRDEGEQQRRSGH